MNRCVLEQSPVPLGGAWEAPPQEIGLKDDQNPISYSSGIVYNVFIAVVVDDDDAVGGVVNIAVVVLIPKTYLLS